MIIRSLVLTRAVRRLISLIAVLSSSGVAGNLIEGIRFN